MFLYTVRSFSWMTFLTQNSYETFQDSKVSTKRVTLYQLKELIGVILFVLLSYDAEPSDTSRTEVSEYYIGTTVYGKVGINGFGNNIHASSVVITNLEIVTSAGDTITAVCNSSHQHPHFVTERCFGI